MRARVPRRPFASTPLISARVSRGPGEGGDEPATDHLEERRQELLALAEADPDGRRPAFCLARSASKTACRPTCSPIWRRRAALMPDNPVVYRCLGSPCNT